VVTEKNLSTDKSIDSDPFDIFKAVAYFNGQIQVIEIQKFKQTKFKPFIALSMGGAGVVTGACQ